jgi:putative endonuclease
MIRRLTDFFTSIFSLPELPLARGERHMRASAEPRSTAGAGAEGAAARLLRQKGYRILCRNRANTIAELDIVARDGDSIVFVEVRARSRTGPVHARDTLTRDKRRRLARAAELFLRQHRLGGCQVRIDLVAVELGENSGVVSMEHIVNAVGGTHDGR